MHQRRCATYGFVVLTTASGECFGNVGIPMLVLAWPFYVVALLPVIALEAYVGTRSMGVEWDRVIGVSAVGNLWSTLAGIPIVWVVLFAIEMFVGVSANALGLDSSWEYVLFPFMIAWIGGDNIWLAYLAFVLLAVPFCAISIWIERRVALRRLPDLPPERVSRWVRDANVWSYGLLVTIAAVYPILLTSRAA